MNNSKIGLVLSGGGARGAYQVGVLSAIIEILQAEGLPSRFDFLTGVSAGAINASFLASTAHMQQHGVKKLCDLWSHLSTDQVFYGDVAHLGTLGFKWMSDLSFGAIKGTSPGRALLDTAPLKELLDRNINFDQIQRNIQDGLLDALALTAIDYRDSSAVTFIQSKSHKGWKKARRFSEPAQISSAHIMASSAIPLLFPPIGVDNRYFGDGCVRNSHPCAPSIYLGSEKMIVIGVRSLQTTLTEKSFNSTKPPSVARVINVLLNAVLLDGIELDVERLEKVNEFIRKVPPQHQTGIQYKPIDYVWISPSVDIGALAASKANKLPRMIRYLLKGLGTLEEANEIISYLLFESSFCTQLIEIGFEDGMKARDQIVKLYQS